jgi:hypothetical protein
MNAPEAFRRRNFAGRRLVVSLLRALHIAGLVGTGSAFLGAGNIVTTSAFTFLLVASGIGIMVLDRWSDPAYLRQVNGLAMLAKLLALSVLVYIYGMNAPLFWSVLVLSVLIAHAPARIRHRQLF